MQGMIGQRQYIESINPRLLEGVLRDLSGVKALPSDLATPARDGGTEPKAGQTHLTEAVLDILETLADSPTRLTQGRLMQAMEQAGRTRGKSTLGKALPELIDAGLVDNKQKASPRGYAITKEGRSRLETA